LHANTVVPALVAKYFLPKLSKTNRSVFAALSARVGSISDNRLGGWYAYRASKAALNMIIKTAAIEMQRVNKHAIVVGLHPGTVDSALSKPFQARVPEDRLFTPAYAADRLITVLGQLQPADTGQCWDWQGLPIQP
jgi:NAD(P)-dependent dehydrogenase (short-subunit alcohol dehydrogenase family)